MAEIHTVIDQEITPSGLHRSETSPLRPHGSDSRERYRQSGQGRSARLVPVELVETGGHLLVRLPTARRAPSPAIWRAPTAGWRLTVHRWRFFVAVARGGPTSEPASPTSTATGARRSGGPDPVLPGQRRASSLRAWLLVREPDARPARPSRCARNTRTQARRNIHAHYDLSNELYALFLDPGMTYSGCGLRSSRGLGLEEAQRRKYQRLAQWAGLSRASTCSRSAADGAGSPSTPPPSSAAASPASPSPRNRPDSPGMDGEGFGGPG